MERNSSDNDVVKAVNLMKEIGEFSSHVEASVKNLITKYQEDNIVTDKGISLLELKSHLFLNYMINVAYVVLRKCHGNKIESDEAISRLVELRTVLEKIRPIEAKLKYNIDKLLKFVSGNITENDPLQFRANPDNLVCETNGDSDEDETNDKKEKSTVYQPPKLVPMHFDEDKVDKEGRLREQAKKKALSSSIMQELREEYDEGPEEIKEGQASYKKIINAANKRRTEYEEDHFVRLQISAKEKHELKKRRFMTGLNDLTHFGDISALSNEFVDRSGPAKKKGKHSKLKKGGKKFKKKGFKKRK